MSKKDTLKMVVKKVAPKATYGTDPTNPWSMKANINETPSLDAYLSSRGFNPKFATKDVKIAHSKSREFLKWKQDHAMRESMTTTNTPTAQKSRALVKSKHVHKEIRTGGIHQGGLHEATDEKDMVCFDIPLLIRVLEFTREEMSSDIELHNMVERLINMRETSPLKMSEYDAITQKLVKENHIAIAMGKMLDDESGMVLTQIEELERGCAMIRSYIGKDYEKQLPAWVQAKVTLATDYMSTVGNYLVSKNEKVNESLGDDFLKMMKDKGIKHRVHGTPDQEKQRTMDKLTANKAKADASPAPKKTSTGTFGTTHGYGQGRYMGDSVELEGEVIDEAKSAAMRLSAAWNREKAKSSASIQRGKEMMNKIKQDVKAKSEKPPVKEDVMKSARIIKSIYKKKNMKEEMYDHEKDDKGNQSYGKPPKVGKSKAEGEDKTQSAAVLKGGTTLTGQGRDTIEIDPMMRTRPTTGSPEADRSKKSIG